MRKYRYCVVCDKRLPGRKVSYCSVRCKNKYHEEHGRGYIIISKAKRESIRILNGGGKPPSPLKQWYLDKYPMREYDKDIKSLKLAFECVAKFIKEIKNIGCMICGYNKSYGGLHFHHIGSKSNTIASLTNWLQVLKEFLEHDIVLICANCHAEVHEGSLDISHLNPINIEKSIRRKALDFGRCTKIGIPLDTGF